MNVLTFLACWFVAGIVVALFIVAGAFIGGEPDTEAPDPWDDWDAQSEVGW